MKTNTLMVNKRNTICHAAHTRGLPVHLQEPLGFLVQLRFGSSHLVLLRQQLVLLLQQLVLTLLHCRQQILLVLWGNEVIKRKDKEKAFSVILPTLFQNVIQMFQEKVKKVSDNLT